MMKLNRNLFRFCIWSLFMWPYYASSTVLIAPECRPLELEAQKYTETHGYDSGLLWKISKSDTQESYVFGTIHVADERVLNLPDEVSRALHNSKQFVMEALPDPSQALLFMNMWHLEEGRKLNDILSKPIFDKTVEILSAYHLPEEAVMMMKPWAAYLTMNYPPEIGPVLDLELLRMAQVNGAEILGLETLQEQGNVLNDLSFEVQIRLLTDTVCHYNVVKEDFEKMKILYLDRDLQGLLEYSNRYSISNDDIYKDLLDKLLTQRNYKMVERMQAILNKGNAFIAIGAMHLAGKQGVLALLTERGYKVTQVY